MESMDEENLLTNTFQDGEEKSQTKLKKQNKFLKLAIIILLFTVIVLCLAWTITVGRK